MKTNDFSLLSKKTTSTTNTSLMRAFAVFFFLLLGYGSLNAQNITTIAGNGTNSSTGDGGQATAATTNTNSFITTHTNGDIYIVEQNITGRRVRKIEAASGIITTVCGTGSTGFSGDGGLATSATLDNPSGVAIDASGNIYISDTNNNRIRKITAGIINTICGDGTSTSTGDGFPATAATTDGPASLFFDATFDNLYFTEVNRNKVRKINISSGLITTICNTAGTTGSGGDGGLATAATLNSPWGGAIDAAGNIYISEVNSHRIRKITASTGFISTICNTTSTATSTGDGALATNATINQPYGVCVDKTTGDVYVSEFSGNRVRKITASTGLISRVCGTGAFTSTGDGGLPTLATVNRPVGVHYVNNKLYIGENFGHRIRVICPTMTLTSATLANGSVGTIYSQTLTQTGLTTPIWSVSTGSLPAGLALNTSNGTISGTPTTAGTFTFTISITEGGCSQSRLYSILVCPIITIIPASLANGTLGSAYSQALAQTGLTTPTWSVSAGSLPSGLALSASTISGTATATGIFNFTISVTDGSCTQIKVYSIVICPIITINTSTLAGGTVGSVYSQTLTQTGLSTPTWSVTIGTLPAGLALASGTGTISGTPTTAGTSNFTVSATEGGCSQSRSYSIVVCPIITISPASIAFGTLGSAYSQTFTQTGLTGTPVWSISVGSLNAGLALASGTGTISGTPTSLSSPTFTITVSDGSGCIGTANYAISVVCPTLVFTTLTATNATVGTPYTLNAGVTGNTQSVVYSVSSLPAGLLFNTTTGAISGTPTVPTASATYTVTATQGTCSVTRGYTFAVVCPTITVTPAAFSTTFTTGTPITNIALASTGASGPYAYTITSGTLPSGLTLLTGIISGTPIVGQVATPVTITSTASTGCTGTVVYTFAVSTPCPTITITPATLVGGIVGTVYTQTFTQTGLTGTPTWSISTGSLPAGLALASGTGTISGTPTTAGTSSFLISVTDGSCSQNRSYSIVVCPIITINPATLAGGVNGIAYSQTLTQTGLTGTLTWSVTVGILPNGLALATSTGNIFGTLSAAAGTYTFTVSVTSGAGCTQTKVYSIVVTCPPIVFTNTTATNATVGTPYTLNAGVTGNTQPVFYTASALPIGLTLNSSTGAISGTPTVATAITTYSITAIQITCSVTQNYTFAVVCPTLVFTNTTATNATVGTAYTLNAGVTGNTASVIYSVAPTLPTGLSIDTNTGAITGTPINASLSATYTVTATQGTCIATQSYIFAVACVGTAINPASLSNGTVGIAYTQTLTPIGFSVMLDWSVTGTLPDGLFINGLTGTISGTPTTAGTFPFVVNVTDGVCSQTRNYSIVIAPPAPNVPNTDIAFVASANNVVFSWTAVPNAASYEVRTSTTIINSNIVWNASTLVQTPSTNPPTLNFITNKDNIAYDVTTYYSVRALNSSGAFFGWSSIVSIFVSSYNNAVTALNNDLSTQINTLPNPTNGVVVVSSDILKEKSIKFVLIDAMGKILLEEQTINGLPYEINLDKIASGLYYLKIIGKDNISIKKIVKR